MRSIQSSSGSMTVDWTTVRCTESFDQAPSNGVLGLWWTVAMLAQDVVIAGANTVCDTTITYLALLCFESIVILHNINCGPGTE